MVAAKPGCRTSEILQQALIMSQHVLHLFARQQPPIDLDHTGIGNEIHLHPALDHSHIAGGRAEAKGCARSANRW